MSTTVSTVVSASSVSEHDSRQGSGGSAGSSRRSSLMSHSDRGSSHSSSSSPREDGDSEGHTSKHRRTSRSKKSTARSPTNEELYDTDLEIEDEKTDYHVAGPMIYLEVCRELGVVPASYFVRHYHSEALRMRHHGLGALGAKAIAVPLVNNTSVLELDLEDNWLEGEGAVYLSQMLKENIYLNSVNLAENRLGSLGAQAICEALNNNAYVTRINLSGNDFQVKDEPFFAATILENSTVRYLDLSHNDFGSESSAQLTHAIGENETLEMLDLSWNHFRGPSAVDLVDAIKGNTRLKTVNLAWNGLGNEGAISVMECLKNNDVLLHLDITSNRITMDGAAIIANGLDANESLKVFKMGKNPIGTKGAMMILNAIHNERSVLRELDLTEVCVDKEFVELYKDMRESRELTVKHGQVIGDYVIKGSPPKPQIVPGSTDDLSPEELAALQRLEDFLENDPMARIMHHLKQKNLRLIDLFNQFDKDKNYIVSLDEFKSGVKKANIGLSDEQVDVMLSKLDRGVKDGMIDYRELAVGTARTQGKQRRMARRLIDSLEGRAGSSSARGGSQNLQRLLPALSRSLGNLKTTSTSAVAPVPGSPPPV